MIRWFACVFCYAVGVAGSASVALAATYTLTDGTKAEGEPISYTAAGVVLKQSDGTFAPRVGWTNFTQEALKEFAKQPKAKPFVEPYVEVEEPEAEKKPALEIKPKPLKRLERPEAKAGLGSVFSSSLTVVLLLLVWAANIYAGFEIGVLRNYHPVLVAGIAAVAPVLGPVLFLCLPTRIQKSHDELAAEAMAGHMADVQHQVQFQVGHSGGAEQGAEGEVAEAAPEQPKVTVYQRGQTTFNRRFFETKFAGFLKMVPGEAEKDMVMFIRSARGEHVGSRLTRILQNEIHLQVNKGDATADVIIPFADIFEIQIRPKEAPATH
jgi:hypothetical protein